MVKQIFQISDSAAEQIKTAAELSESSEWPLRISLNISDQGKFNYIMGLINPKKKISAKSTVLIF